MLMKLFLMMLFAITLNAQTADEVIQKIQTKFSTVEDLKANFTQEIISSLNETPITLTGKFYFKKENNLRIEVKNRTIVSNGITVWNDNQTMNKVIISNYEGDYTSFSLPEIIISYPGLCKKEIVSNVSEFSVIKLTPNDNQLNFKTALISVNKNDIIEKVVITDFNNMKFTFELDSIKLNTKLSEQLFNFKPTEGAEVIDLR